MNLKIITPLKTAFDGEVREVCLPGAFGEFGILPGHAQMVAGLRTGICSFTGGDDGRKEKFEISGGVCHVEGDNIRVLTNFAESN